MRSQQKLTQARARTIALLIERSGDPALAHRCVAHATEQLGRPGHVDRREFEAALLSSAWAHATESLAEQSSDDTVRDHLGPLPSADDDGSLARTTVMLACCHGALPEAAQTVAMLNLCAGMGTAELARTFSVSETTMAKRLGFTHRRLRSHLHDSAPGARAAGVGIARVLTVIALIFDDGIVPARHRGHLINLPRRAVELGRAAAELFPDEPEPRALLAFMLMTRARRRARQGADGTLVPLDGQDRSRWHRGEINEGLFLLRGSQRHRETGPYQLHAAIQASHVVARDAAETDWTRILCLYDRLLHLAPSEAVACGRASAMARVRGGEAALAALERWAGDSHLYHATRADLLGELGRHHDAEAAWSAALSATRREREPAHLLREAGH